MHALISPQYVWLAEALFTALILGLLFSLAVGVLLLTSPNALFALNKKLSRWIDTSEQFKRLDEPRQSERLFYRHHKAVGALVTAGAVFVLWRWLFAVPKASVKIFMLGHHTNPLWDWLPPAVDALIVVLHVFVLAIGVIITVRPSLLKNIEKTANQWHRGPQAPLDVVVTTLDTSFALYPRLGGLLLVSAAGGCLVYLLPVLLDHLRG
jgi:hypothetical protein